MGFSLILINGKYMENWLIFELDADPFVIDLSKVEFVFNACEIIKIQNKHNSKIYLL